MAQQQQHGNDERRPLLDREPIEDLEDAIEGKKVNYKTTGWKSSAVLLAKCQIGLGVLALPAALDTLGAVYGLLSISLLGIIITYSNHTVGTFWRNHKDIHSVADATRVIFGDFGAEAIGLGFWLYEIGIAASGILATSIGINVLTQHAACTVLFVGLATLLTCAMASFREFRHIAFLGWAGLVSIVVSVCILMGSVASVDKPPLAPDEGWDKQLRLIGHPSPAAALSAVMNMMFAYGGTPAFFPIISEMRNPKDYTRAMLSAQVGCTVFYFVVAAVVWASVGVYIASPALGSAGPVIKKICYGIAFPGLLAGAILYMHVSAKYLFVRLMRGTQHLHEETFWHWVGWLGSVSFCGLIAFCVAEAIPFFSSLLGVIGAAFGSIFCLILPACMFFFDNPPDKRNPQTRSHAALRLVNILMIALGIFLMLGGMWASVLSIQEQYRTGQIGHPFSCADNS